MIDSILNQPIFIKVIGSLITIIVLNSILKNLSISVIAGTFVLSFWIGHSLSGLAYIAWDRFYSLDNISLLIAVLMIIWFSSQMSEAGVMKEMVDTLKTMLSPKNAMVFLPALIGLLPMPGGAVFSAPMVDECDKDKILNPVVKARANYWFRHLWEYWWPMYPGVLLMIDITGLKLYQVMPMGILLSLASLIGGYIFLLRNVHIKGAASLSIRKALPDFIRLILPIPVLIFIYLLIRWLVPSIAGLSRYLPLCIGICVAICLLQVQRPISLNSWKKIIINKNSIVLVLLVGLIRIYGAVIESPLPEGVLLVEGMKEELITYHIPMILVVILIPFICGLTTGIAVGFVGASFPIVMAILGENPAIRNVMSYTVLAFACGYMGMMLSPVHICLIVTNEYFKTPILSSLRGFIAPVLTVLSVAGIISWVLMSFI